VRAAAPAAAASAEAQPISYVMDVTPPAAASPIASAAMAALPAASVSPAALVGAPVIGALSPAARAQFTDGLVVEVNRQIGDKCIPAAIAAWILTLVIVARFSITTFGTQTGLIIGVVMAFAIAGIVSKVVKGVLENKYLTPIASLSDEMLVNRYNEAKADRRAAGTRAAISWAAIAVIVFVLIIVWIAVQHH
jgi:hypothetical protein